ncbi:PRC and DUF2382 domain-containing protein [Arthrobacter sp. MSA 4-2]|uniref:PRC and DUF2382 domain-containing protein n=1 Tax=Arthrobacter sp. MSA 4-2 TaxID=2794349 RepID=UPI0018E78B54|nr:PRC and DUF2382 domain-containing protein [Arthrobacter sp. MSA 4-2]MBJ2121387.1 PRC and DUF2382 domain-containing protein [Arthrobacter sp. MSA 4-2]
MITQENLNDLAAGRGNVYTDDGGKLGSIGQLYVDDETGQPSWVSVNTGLFGTSESFVPLQAASVDGNDVRVPYSKDLVKDAPKVEKDGHLSPEEEDRLYRHYSLNGSSDGTRGVDYDTTRTTGRDAVGHDTSGPTTDEAMTRSEEQLRVGTESREAGRVRLRKFVVSENVSQTVPVSREEVRLEREPITDANRGAAMAGPAISEEEHEVVLHEERPVVEKEAVPVERVRLDKETVTEQHTVNEEVRKEQIEADGDHGRGRH